MPTRTVQPVSNPYAGGAIVADFTPYLNLALQQKAKEEAKAAAAQKVYDDMMKDPNPNGIRQQDTKGFYDRTTQWRNFGIQNKELIKDPTKDGGKALSDFRRMTTEIAGYINQSKDAKDRDKQFAPIFSNPEISRRIRPSWMIQYDSFQKPIDLGGGGTIDAEGAFGAKPLDMDKFITTITRGQQLDKKDLGATPIQGEPLKVRRTFEYKYANPMAIAETARAEYQTNESVQEEMDNLYAKEGARIDKVKGVTQAPSPYMQELGKDFEKMYGRPMKDASDLAAIWGYKRAGGGKKEDVIEDNKTAIMEAEEAKSKRLAGYMHSFKGMDERKQDIWMDNYIKNDLIGETKTNTPFSNMFGTAVKEIELDAITSEALKKDGKTPDRLLYDVAQKTFTPVFYKYDANGNIIVNEKNKEPEVDNLLTGDITYNQFKLNLVKSAPQGQQAVREMTRNKEIGAGKKVVESNTKSTNFVQPVFKMK
jgi:hypothetical protein